MRRMLDPKTIALIGASEAEGTVGRTIMENLLRSEGRALFPVNPNHKTVFDVPCFPSIGAVPEPVDLAVVATPAATVPDVLLECAKAGVHGAIVVSAGFGETGREGLALERRIKKILRDYPMRVVGPNCLGIIRPSVGLNASFLTVAPERGNIALVSQSGALGTAIGFNSAGQNVLVIDLKDGRTGGLGIGLVVGSQQASLSTTQTDGIWIAGTSNGHWAVFTASGTTITLNNLVLFGSLGALVVAIVRAAGGVPATTDMLNFLFAGPELMPTLGAGAMAVSLATVVVVSVLSGFYPALLAMRVTPVEAMATEE